VAAAASFPTSRLAAIDPFVTRFSAVALIGRLRRPSWRGAAWTFLFLLLLGLGLALSQIPRTPDVAELARVRTEAPSRVLSADGKELAAFRRVNRD